MYKQLRDLAERLEAEGRKQDSILVFSAMVNYIPEPVPKFETTVKLNGVLHHTKVY